MLVSAPMLESPPKRLLVLHPYVWARCHRSLGEEDLAEFHMGNVKRTNARAPSLKKWIKLRSKVCRGGRAVAEQEWLSVDVDGPTMLAQEELARYVGTSWLE